MTHRILVVDDEPDITALVAYHLAKAGFRVSTAANGPDALKAAREEKPDIVILDLMLPGISGYDILAEMRKREETRDVGVILLTARREETDRIRGLTLGADDYLTKPFDIDELLARMRALLRRVEGDEILRVADLEVNSSTREVRRGEREIDLTAREYDLLEFMAVNPRRVLSRDLLLSRVWDREFGVTANAVEVYIAYLRKKVDAPGERKLIHTIRGAGYALKGT
jgi:DNA-binding response OmpR family regulator